MSDSEAIRRVRRRFSQAIKAATRRKNQLFLELFSGSGQISAAWRESGFGVLSFELSFGDENDLTRPSLQRLITGWLTSHCIAGIWFGTPCSSWSLARRGPYGSAWGPLRSQEFPLGLPDLSPADRFKVREGNRTAQLTAKLIRKAVECGVPCALENPHTSRLWSSPWIAPLLSVEEFRGFVVDMCQFGAPWRKRTRVGTWLTREPGPGSSLAQPHLCRGRKGICSSSGQPHIVLCGRTCKRAESYPESFASEFARLLSFSAEQRTVDKRVAFGTKIS